MLIKECRGYELIKEQSNTSEDFFNRSEITFTEAGIERTFHVLYVRYFEEKFPEFTPYKQDPIFTESGRDVTFKDIVALVCLLNNPGLRSRKRLYISSAKEFASFFKGIDYGKLPEIFKALELKKVYDLSSPLDFIVEQLKAN